HLEGRARVMREDEDRHVIGRVLAPPASPGFVVPHDSDRTEHVPSHDPCTEVLEPLSREVIVGPGRAGLGCALQLLERLRREEPLVQRLAAASQRFFATLVGAGAVAVEGDAEAVYPQLGHRRSPWWGTGRIYLMATGLLMESTGSASG